MDNNTAWVFIVSAALATMLTWHLIDVWDQRNDRRDDDSE